MGHAYAVLGVHTLNNGQRLVKLRNPHGTDSFTGAYSDTSGDWTQALQDEVGYTPNTDDGIIWMTISDYHTQVEETYINYDVTNWHEAHFLMLDDTTSNPGSWRWCGSSCTRHELNLTSDVDQTVYVSAHTWDKRCVADICETVQRKHGVDTPGDQYVRTFQYGSADSKPVEMSAGETLTITTEWDWTNQNLPKDWSVVAWAPDGNLTLTHSDSSLTSDSLPYIADNGQVQEEDVVDDTTDEVVDDTTDEVVDDTTDEVIEDNTDEVIEDNTDDTSHVVSAQEQEFIDYVESHTPTWDGGGCGVGLTENPYYDTETSNWGYQLSFMYTCDYDFLGADVKIAMTPSDWESVTFLYQVKDETTGEVRLDSMLSGCEPDDFEPHLDVCTFSLRHYSNPQAYGVTEEWQRRGGVRTPGSVYGMRWYYTHFYWI